MFPYRPTTQILMVTGIWSTESAWFCQLRSRKIPTYDFFSVHRESLLPFFTAFLTIRYLVIKFRVVCTTVNVVINRFCKSWKRSLRLYTYNKRNLILIHQKEIFKSLLNNFINLPFTLWGRAWVIKKKYPANPLLVKKLSHQAAINVPRNKTSLVQLRWQLAGIKKCF